MAYPLNMINTIASCLLFSLYLSSSLSSATFAPTPAPNAPAPELTFENARLRRDYTALQAIKRFIHSDPLKITKNWDGPNVCAYTGVVCAPSLDDPSMNVVAGLDLNQGDIAGQLPPEIELLEELGFLHINSNRFCGIIPEAIRNMPLLYELDISNNRFVGPFPKAVLDMPGLKYLDIRFNNFEGSLPPELFERELDAIFVNNNRFTGPIPETLGKSPASVVVFANNKLSGCIPASIGNMINLEQVLFSYNNLSGCLPEEMGRLPLVQVLDISGNKFTGDVPDSVCNLPKLAEFNIANNYFVKVGAFCCSPTSGINLNDSANCLVGLPKQKPEAICSPIVGINGAIDCSQCRATSSNSDSESPLISPAYQTRDEPPQIESTVSPPTISLSPTSFPDPPSASVTVPTQAPMQSGYAPVPTGFATSA